MNDNSTITPTGNASLLRRLVGWADRPAPAQLAGSWLHTLVRIALIVFREMEANHLALRTSALTYALILSMVPLLAMSTAVVKGLGGGDQLRQIVHSYIDTLEQAAPAADGGHADSLLEPTRHLDDQPEETSTRLTDHLRAAADRVFDYVDRTSFATLGSVGILGVFLSVILVLSQIETAMNTIWHVADSRSPLRKIADYLTLMVLLPIAINIALAAGTMLTSETLNVHLDRFIPVAWLQSLLLRGVPILFLTVALYVAYIFFPNTKVKTLPTLIGALFAGTLWFTTQNLFISLQIGVANYNAIYGSFATIPLLLVWIYFGWLFILIGAEMAYAIHHRSTYRLVRQPDVPKTQLSAAFDSYATIADRFNRHQGTTLDDLVATHPCYPPDLLAAVIDLLINGGLLHHSRETDELMPSLPPAASSHQRIIDAILGTRSTDSPGGRTSDQLVASLRKQGSQDHVARPVQTGSETQPGNEVETFPPPSS